MAMADGSPLPHWISLVGRELTVGNSSIREPFYDVVITATDPSGVQVSSSMTLHLTRDGALPTVSSTSITLAADQHHAVLSGTDALNATGNSLNNKLVGNSAANELRGLDGDDELNGRGGADTLWGGQGNDVYYVDHVGDLVIELAGEGHADLVISTIGYTLPDHVEQLSLLTHAHVNLTGNALNNKLTGQNGDNVLDGKEGADTLRGYGGNDTYVIDNAGDTITELANEGTLDVAQLWTSFSFLALSANRGAAIERIEVMGNDALNATGNAKGQQIAGNEAANELRGGGGADTILGQGGDDRLILGTAERASLGTSSYDGGEGQDTLALASDQSGVLLDFSAYGSTTFTGIERVNLTGGGHNTARLTIDQLLHMPDAGVDKLIVLGNAGDAVQLAGGSGNWSSEGTQSWQGLDYSVYSHSGAVGRELFVQQGITVM
jgi:Ca2+-binding RTX toxin-like protein